MGVDATGHRYAQRPHQVDLAVGRDVEPAAAVRESRLGPRVRSRLDGVVQPKAAEADR